MILYIKGSVGEVWKKTRQKNNALVLFLALEPAKLADLIGGNLLRIQPMVCCGLGVDL